MGQLLQGMESMLRDFYSEASGTTIHPTYNRPGMTDATFGEGTERDELTRLEYITNRFEVNPRPRLVLVVEGKGEYDQFPRLAEMLLRLPFGRAGIEIVNLRGYPNFEGNLKDRLSAWYRLIDYHHHHNTVVFVVLDPHGRAEELRRRSAGHSSTSWNA